jgi:hypothetical protein
MTGIEPAYSAWEVGSLRLREGLLTSIERRDKLHVTRGYVSTADCRRPRRTIASRVEVPPDL